MTDGDARHGRQAGEARSGPVVLLGEDDPGLARILQRNLEIPVERLRRAAAVRR